MWTRLFGVNLPVHWPPSGAFAAHLDSHLFPPCFPPTDEASQPVILARSPFPLQLKSPPCYLFGKRGLFLL